MDNHLSKLFLMEIQQQCKFAISDYTRLALAISIPDNYALFHLLQSFLIAAANISKILWPMKSYAQRGQDLRSSLSIDETSPLKTKNPRNIFEHFDERLEEWYTQSPHHNIVDMSSGITDDMGIDGHVDFIRYFNSATYTFIFRGDRYEINPLYIAIKNLLTKVNNELSKPPSMSFPP